MNSFDIKFQKNEATMFLNKMRSQVAVIKKNRLIIKTSKVEVNIF